MPSSEVQTPHRRTIAKSTTTELKIPNHITDHRQQLKAASSSPPGGGRGIDPDGSCSLLAGTLGSAGEVIRGALPALVPWTIIFSLIFGGCCSNVCSFCSRKLGMIVCVGADLTFVTGLHIGEDREVSSRSIWRLLQLTFSADCGSIPEKNPIAVRESLYPTASLQQTGPKTIPRLYIYRFPHHLRSICRNGLIHMAHPLLRLPSALLPSTQSYSHGAMASEHRIVLHRQYAQQLCLRLQYLGSGPYHPSKRGEPDVHAHRLRMGEEIYEYADIFCSNAYCGDNYGCNGGRPIQGKF